LALTLISDEALVIINFLSIIFLGVSIGLGLPSCLSFFADLTSIESRGLISGIVWSSIGGTMLLFAFLMSIFTLQESIVFLALWRLLGSFAFIFLTKGSFENPIVQESLSYLDIIRKKDMLLYLLPWIVFSIVNFAETPILEKVFGTETFTFIGLIGYAIIGVTAIIGGLTADFLGRKRVVILGFMMVGIEYAALSAFYNLPSIAYLFMVFDGITWGLFFPVFFMTVWGDLGEQYAKEKYYALGGLPFLLANFASILVRPYVEVIPPSAAFSFAAFFLFLAVVPLMYAPETLPERVIRERELKRYIEKAKRIKEKYS
ncbi:hypothetical protein H5T51_00855, partial [Candidatus Bathyarchaeota archaeon]|nr:hypothetical protein [Candidatus Bathyarchaeota archaeon]